MNKITTIKLNKETRERLEKLREHKRETYDEILRKILYVLNLVKIDCNKAQRTLETIDLVRQRYLEQEITKKKEKYKPALMKINKKEKK